MATGQDVFDRVKLVLQDDNVRWANTELIKWVNDGRRKIVEIKPDTNPTTQVVQLTEGTKQSLPAEAYLLTKVNRNMGVGGATPGRAIRLTHRRTLDDFRPGWHAIAKTVEITHYLLDERNPKVWHCYPPSDGTGHVEIVYPAIPADIVLGAALGLDDFYVDAMVDFVLYRAYQKQKDTAGAPQLSQMHYGAFMRSLGMKDRQETVNSPNTPAEMRSMAQAGVI